MFSAALTGTLQTGTLANEPAAPICADAGGHRHSAAAGAGARMALDARDPSHAQSLLLHSGYLSSFNRRGGRAPPEPQKSCNATNGLKRSFYCKRRTFSATLCAFSATFQKVALQQMNCCSDVFPCASFCAFLFRARLAAQAAMSLAPSWVDESRARTFQQHAAMPAKQKMLLCRKGA